MNAADTSAARTRAIPKSIVARVVDGVRYAITGVAPDTWFGPSEPLKPMAPADVAGRRFDYPTGYNLQYAPRSYETVSFADLRALADNCDILRLVIETRKDQIEAQDWDIRPKRTAAGEHPKASAFAKEIAGAKAFFASPDREHDFAQWTRQIAEEMFVTDATSLYKRRDRAGRVYAFEIIDGATIAPRIDAWGRTPVPPDVAYQQILHGVPAADYARGEGALTADELIYFPRNKRPGHIYGHSPVEQIIMTANIVARRALHQLAFYTDGNLTDAIFTAPSGWTSDQIHSWQKFWDSLFAGNLQGRRHGTWVPEGTKYVPLKDTVLKDAFDEYLARIICFCFSISPQPFVSQVNRATAESAKAQAAEEGLAPVLNWFKRLFDNILQRHLGFGGLEFVWIDDREMDPSTANTIDVADVRAGIRTINEVRMSRGLDPQPGCDTLMVATGAGYVPVTQTGAKSPSGNIARPAFGKFNRNHWPAGAPESQGGQFAPKGEGGSGTAAGGPRNVDVDSFGHPVDAEERRAMNAMRPPGDGASAVQGSDLSDRQLEDLRDKPDIEPRGPDAVGSHGYVPQPGDEALLARAIFAEGGKTRTDMPAFAWSIVNRIGRPKYPDSLNDVIHDPRQFAFAPEGSPSKDWSLEWKASGTPEKLSGKNAISWQYAVEVAHDVLGGSIPDPTGGATHFFTWPAYNGNPNSAPRQWRHSLRDNRYRPSSYVGTGGNHFFILNPETEWLSYRRRNRRK